MRASSLTVQLAGTFVLWLAVAPALLVGAGAGDVDSARPSKEAVALHEMLEGTSGRREMWTSTPELVILSSVMQYAEDGVKAGYVATDETLTSADIAALTVDLTRALDALTAGQITAFSQVRTLAVAPGESARIFNRGQIVVGRFRGLRSATGTLGWGGRMTRAGTISAAAVMLDRDFDAGSHESRLLRTHELAHALGYNHVESVESVMNPRVGSDLTEFDRQAARLAFALPQQAARLDTSSPVRLATR